MNSTIRVVLAALLSVLLLAGCARIPTSGPVTQGQQIVPENTQGVALWPDPPADDATQAQIVRGFLNAGTGTDSNYATAREYLSPELQASWDPTARVLIYNGQSELVEVGTDLFEVTVQVVAELGADGVYQELAEPEPRTLQFRLAPLNDQWRIVSAEDGLVILTANFELVFSAHTLYFFDTEFRFLVPDVRWFPLHASAPTRIVQALLAGPAQWLSGAAVSAFPAGVSLRGPVTSGDGAVSADFTAVLSSAPTDRLPFMRLQLEESLREAADGASARISVNGTPLEVQLPAEGTVRLHTLVNASPLVYRDGELGYLSGESISPLPGSELLTDVLRNLQPLRGAVASDQGLAAFRTQDGVVAIPFETGQPVSIDGRSGLATPSLDAYGFVWTASTNDRSILVGDLAAAAQATLSFEELGGDGILALQVSREGQRVAALVRDGSVVRLVVAAIVRDPTTRLPTALGQAQTVPLVSGELSELAWVDETTVAVLVGDGEGNGLVRVHQLGGTTSEYGGEVRGAVQIAGSNSLAGLRVLDDQGSIFVPTSSENWQAPGPRVGFLVIQA